MHQSPSRLRRQSPHWTGWCIFTSLCFSVVLRSNSEMSFKEIPIYHRLCLFLPEFFAPTPLPHLSPFTLTTHPIHRLSSPTPLSSPLFIPPARPPFQHKSNLTLQSEFCWCTPTPSSTAFYNTQVDTDRWHMPDGTMSSGGGGMGSLGRAAGRGVEGDKVPYQRIQAWNFTTGKPIDLPVPELCSFSAVTQDGEDRVG